MSKLIIKLAGYLTVIVIVFLAVSYHYNLEVNLTGLKLQNSIAIEAKPILWSKPGEP